MSRKIQLGYSCLLGKRNEKRTKRKFDRPAPSLHPIPVSDTLNKVGIDLIILPPSKNGYHYCIILTDYFSKWVEEAPMPTKEAKHVAKFLYKMILHHGCPLEIVSDQGREFDTCYKTLGTGFPSTSDLTYIEKCTRNCAFRKRNYHYNYYRDLSRRVFYRY